LSVAEGALIVSLRHPPVTSYINRYHMPWMPDDLRLRGSNELYKLGLWKGLMHTANTRCFQMAMMNLVFGFSMFDAQAVFVRDVIMGRVDVPASREEMEADAAKWHAEALQTTTMHTKIMFQSRHILDLESLTCSDKVDAKGMAELCIQRDLDKDASILLFRHKSFRSLSSTERGDDMDPQVRVVQCGVVYE
jgi:trimethylamine monooxygenase